MAMRHFKRAMDHHLDKSVISKKLMPEKMCCFLIYFPLKFESSD